MIANDPSYLMHQVPSSLCLARIVHRCCRLSRLHCVSPRHVRICCMRWGFVTHVFLFPLRLPPHLCKRMRLLHNTSSCFKLATLGLIKPSMDLCMVFIVLRVRVVIKIILLINTIALISIALTRVIVGITIFMMIIMMIACETKLKKKRYLNVTTITIIFM